MRNGDVVDDTAALKIARDRSGHYRDEIRNHVFGIGFDKLRVADEDYSISAVPQHFCSKTLDPIEDIYISRRLESWISLIDLIYLCTTTVRCPISLHKKTFSLLKSVSE